MPKDKKMWDNILTVIMSLLCLLWIYPIVLILQNSLKIEGTFTTSTVFKLPTAETFAGLSNYIYVFRLCKCKHKWSWNGFISCVIYCCNTYLINSSDFQFVHCKFCGLTVPDLHTILINIIACHVCVSRCCPCQLC